MHLSRNSLCLVLPPPIIPFLQQDFMPFSFAQGSIAAERLETTAGRKVHWEASALCLPQSQITVFGLVPHLACRPCYPMGATQNKNSLWETEKCYGNVNNICKVLLRSSDKGWIEGQSVIILLIVECKQEAA